MALLGFEVRIVQVVVSDGGMRGVLQYAHARKLRPRPAKAVALAFTLLACRASGTQLERWVGLRSGCRRTPRLM